MDYILIVLLVVLIALFIFSFYKTESFENLNGEVIDSCKDMKPSKLIQLISGGDLKAASQKIKTICETYNIDPNMFTDQKNYPAIASFLVKKGLIKC